ncbi:MAG TPA: hypothetical protein VNL77_18755 [Roseiflexaceae bacterium]|nr:hypothetical protein [Roseiflexaceae bacterium]
MGHYDQRRPRSRPPSRDLTQFTVGERVAIVGAPASYGYNGRVGTIIAIDGIQIRVQVDDPPGDMTCSTFYQEELVRVREAPAEDSGSPP